MRELDVVGIRVETPSNNPIVLLREREGHRYLPVWIGAAEASAIAFAQQGLVPPRPQTHDLLLDVLTALGRTLEEVRITAYRDNIFYAELLLDGGTTVGSRTSDAVALALRAGCRIVGAEDVLDEVGVPVPDEDEGEVEVERLREFLDNVNPEDFAFDEGRSTGADLMDELDELENELSEDDAEGPDGPDGDDTPPKPSSGG
ncbi:bifunctional nuclease family protein [Jannaschia sp. R86511]|uniref:bifunctional nuclease family protein n=1 Tax=Jannaschia sp. R86511 TaxID=3093853 RepID=UPI0036D3DE0A